MLGRAWAFQVQRDARSHITNGQPQRVILAQQRQQTYSIYAMARREVLAMLLGLADEIIPRLFQGRRPRSDQDLKDYLEAGITASVALTPSAEMDAHFLPGAPKVLFPFEDDHFLPDGTALNAVAYLVGLLVQGGHKVLVCCDAGMNRSGLVVARTLMYLGMSADEAIALVRERRAKGDGRILALSNPAFVNWLQKEEKVRC